MLTKIDMFCTKWRMKIAILYDIKCDFLICKDVLVLLWYDYVLLQYKSNTYNDLIDISWFYKYM